MEKEKFKLFCFLGIGAFPKEKEPSYRYNVKYFFFKKEGLSLSFYDQCCKNIGRGVRFRTVDGRVHTGFITKATPTHLHYRPLGNGVSLDNQQDVEIKFAIDENDSKSATEILGYGYGRRYGYGYGRRYGYGYGNQAAWATIAALTILPFLFW
jgi:hypothetical protein